MTRLPRYLTDRKAQLSLAQTVMLQYEESPMVDLGLVLRQLLWSSGGVSQ